MATTENVWGIVIRNDKVLIRNPPRNLPPDLALAHGAWLIYMAIQAEPSLPVNEVLGTIGEASNSPLRLGILRSEPPGTS